MIRLFEVTILGYIPKKLQANGSGVFGYGGIVCPKNEMEFDWKLFIIHLRWIGEIFLFS
jgi:hypothetical protein